MARTTAPAVPSDGPSSELPGLLPVLDPAAGTAGAERVGERIRALRRTRGLTLVQLAALAELSHPFLSQIERGLARPSLASLERIAHALGASQVELLTFTEPGAASAAPAVLRSHEGARGAYGGESEARVLLDAGSPFRSLEVQGTNPDVGPAWVHAEHEWFYVLEGVVEVDLGGLVAALGPGDSASCPGGVPHCWRSPTGSPYRLLIVKEQVHRP